MVWHLLSNAVKLTPAGGSIAVQADRVKAAVVLSVEDTGPGISAERLPGIFDRRQQDFDPSKRQQAGLGLGLVIVRYLVEAHGGTVSAHSAAVGLGATFTVSLPTGSAPSLSSEAEREPDSTHESVKAQPANARRSALGS